MVRAAEGRPQHFISSEEGFWSGGVRGISELETAREPVEVEKTAFRKERWGKVIYAGSVLGFTIFGLLFLLLFFHWYFTL